MKRARPTSRNQSGVGVPPEDAVEATFDKISRMAEDTPMAMKSEPQPQQQQQQEQQQEPEKRTEKTPMMLLNERFPTITNSLMFDTRVDGYHRTHFLCRVTLNGRQFFGEGDSKKVAKHKMAENVLAALPPQDNAIAAAGISEAASRNPFTALVQVCQRNNLPLQTEFLNVEDATTTKLKYICVVSFGDNEPQIQSEPMASKKQAKAEAAKKALKERFNLDIKFDATEKSHMETFIHNKNPCQALHELCSRRGWKVAEEWMPTNADAPTESFHVSFKVGDRSFAGTSFSKRMAKNAAAANAIKELFDIDVSNEPMDAVTAPADSHAHPTPVICGKRSPVDALQDIARVAGLPVYYDNMPDAPTGTYKVKARFGTAECEGTAATLNVAKMCAAAGILRQMNCYVHGEIQENQFRPEQPPTHLHGPAPPNFQPPFQNAPPQMDFTSDNWNYNFENNGQGPTFWGNTAKYH